MWVASNVLEAVFLGLVAAGCVSGDAGDGLEKTMGDLETRPDCDRLLGGFDRFPASAPATSRTSRRGDLRDLA
jgi:hypothetical protein